MHCLKRFLLRLSIFFIVLGNARDSLSRIGRIVKTASIKWCVHWFRLRADKLHDKLVIFRVWVPNNMPDSGRDPQDRPQKNEASCQNRCVSITNSPCLKAILKSLFNIYAFFERDKTFKRLRCTELHVIYFLYQNIGVHIAWQKRLFLNIEQISIYMSPGISVKISGLNSPVGRALARNARWVRVPIENWLFTTCDIHCNYWPDDKSLQTHRAFRKNVLTHSGYVLFVHF